MRSRFAVKRPHLYSGAYRRYHANPSFFIQHLIDEEMTNRNLPLPMFLRSRDTIGKYLG